MKVACVQLESLPINRYHEIFEKILDKAERVENADLIVFPECSFPSYFFLNEKEKFSEAMTLIPHLLSRISEIAIYKKVYIAIGLIMPDVDSFVNCGLLISPDGDIVGKTVKSNLWHFDSLQFKPGKEFDVIDTEFGKVGMIICADARAPEICKILALRGAKIIIDMANLTASAFKQDFLSNMQLDFLLQSRAFENSAWIIMADKCGIEQRSITFAGGSCVIRPDGKIISKASPDHEEVIFADIDLNFPLTRIPKRRPNDYKLIVSQNPPLFDVQKNIPPISESIPFVSSVQFNASNYAEYVCKAEFFVRAILLQGADIILLPPIECEPTEELFSSLYHEIDNSSSWVFVPVIPQNNESNRRFFVISKKYKNEVCNSVRVIDCGAWRIGMLLNDEILIPELSRCLMLYGVQIALWASNERTEMFVPRTRAAENKIYLVHSSKLLPDETSFILNPEGTPVASAFFNTEQAISAQIFTSLALAKQVVPGTDVGATRMPKYYKELVI